MRFSQGIYELLKMFVVLTLIYSCSPVDRPKAVMAFNKAGFNEPNLFVYEVKRKDSNNGIIQLDTISLICSPFAKDSQYTIAWQFLTTEEGKLKLRGGIEVTGLYVNDTFLYIHPPRFGYFKLLQYCPHPFFLNSRAKWDWDLPIGWVVDSLYPITSVDTFKNYYQFEGKVNVSTILGNRCCNKIKGYNVSDFGKGISEFYFDEQLGLIYFEMSPVDKLIFQFTLLNKTSYPSTDDFDKSVVGLFEYYTKKKDKTTDVYSIYKESGSE